MLQQIANSLKKIGLVGTLKGTKALCFFLFEFEAVLGIFGNCIPIILRLICIYFENEMNFQILALKASPKRKKGRWLHDFTVKVYRNN